MCKMSKTYKLLIFDVDGTLYFQKPLRLTMAIRLGLYYCLRPHKIKEVFALQDFRKLRESRVSDGSEPIDNAIYSEVAAKYKMPAQAVEHLVKQWIYDAPLKHLNRYTDFRLRNLIKKARDSGTTVVTFSDYPASDKLIAMDIEVDAQFASTDSHINTLKPDDKGLRVILDTMGINPGQCLMIGDRDEKDGECARRAGVDYIILPTGRQARQNAVLDLSAMLNNSGA